MPKEYDLFQTNEKERAARMMETTTRAEYNADYVNVFTSQLEHGDIAVARWRHPLRMTATTKGVFNVETLSFME